MNRTRATLLFLIILIAFYSSYVAWSIYEYNSYVSVQVEKYDKLFPNAKDYVDPHPYVDFWYGQLAVA